MPTWVPLGHTKHPCPTSRSAPSERSRPQIKQIPSDAAMFALECAVEILDVPSQTERTSSPSYANRITRQSNPAEPP